MRPPRSLVPVLIGAVALATASAFAASPAIPMGGDNLPSALRELPRDPARANRLASGPAWREFITRNPGWVTRWDTKRGTPERAFGPALRLGTMPDTAQALDVAVHAMLRDEVGAWVDADDLKLERASRDPNGWWAHYSQWYGGVRVAGTKVSLRVAASGVPSLALQVHGNLRVETTPQLSRTEAVSRAVSDLPLTTEADPGDVELVVLPGLETGEDDRLAYEVRYSTVSPPGDWTIWVDGHSGEILGRRNAVRFERLEGTVTGSVQALWPTEPGESRGIPYVAVNATSGETTVASDTTNTEGGYLFDPLTGTVTLTAPLGGPFGLIENADNGGETPLVTAEVNADAVSSEDLVFADSLSERSDRTAYYWAMLTHDYIRAVDPGFDRLDYAMPIITDITTSECNAFWNGDGINFFAEGPSCPNIGMIPSVVIHEYGHGITDLQYRPFGAPSGAMHEGFSDYLSATMLDDHRVGHGFFGPGTVLRNIGDDRKVPDDVTGQSHADGLIIAGAVWDVRERLGRETTDRLWHFARNGLSNNFDDYFLDFLLTDDDDGNIYNGTPNLTAIVQAFEKHGIGDYSIRVSHAPLPDTEDEAKNLTLTATFLSIFPLEESDVTAHLRITAGGVTTESARVMTPTGEIREFSLDLGNLAEGTEVAYWMTAEDEAGHTVMHPEAGDVKPLRFRVGLDTTPPRAEHVPLGDQPAENVGFPVEVEAWDNLDAGLGSVVVSYTATGDVSGEVTLTHVGGRIHAGVIPVDLFLEGSQVDYSILVSDLASSPNTVRLPAEGTYGFTVVRGFVRDLEEDNGSFGPSGDWEWGPATFFTEAYSGSNVWGTRLDRNYRDDKGQTLTLGPLDLSQWTRAAFTFRHTYQIETGWDGGVVEASTGDGEWATLVPAGGYPVSSVVALEGAAGFSGIQPEWQAAQFDMSAYTGAPTVFVRLRFQADESVNAPGWYVDNPSLVERSVRFRPGEPTARSGRNGIVPLTWEAPAGLAEGDESRVLGYHVYRSVSDLAPVRITAEPVDGLAFDDTTPTNGVFHNYSVSAVYQDGESPRGPEAEAIPYLAVAEGAEEDTLRAAVIQGGTEEIALTLANEGTGFLKVNLWPALPGQTLDDVRISWDVPQAGKGMSRSPRIPVVEEERAEAMDPASLVAAAQRSMRRLADQGKRLPSADPVPPPFGMVYTELHTDPKDVSGFSNPDLAKVEVGVHEENLYFRLTAIRNWANPVNEANFLIAIDLDGNLDTGADGDLTILAGYLPQQNLGVPAVLLDGAGRVIGLPHHNDLQAAARSVTFGIRLADVAGPESVLIRAAVLNRFGSLVVDHVPDQPRINWLTLDKRNLTLFTGRTGAVGLRLDGNRAMDIYETLLLMETNDPDRPAITMPLTFEVGDETAVSLLSFTSRSGDLGIRLEWRTVSETDHAGFAIYRRQLPLGEEVHLGPGSATSTEGLYRFEDRQVNEGVEYEYRLADIDRAGHLTFHGPLRARYLGTAGLTAPVLRQNLPNPFRANTRLRFGLESARPVTLRVYSVEGRLVRTLVEGETFPRGFHEVPWDGIDDAGRRVSAGVYAYRLATPGNVQQRKMVVLP